MNIVFRADASIHIGSGHVMRCLVLAKSLRNNGHNVCFVMRKTAGNMIEFTNRQGFDVFVLPMPITVIEPQSNDDYAAWLHTSELEDATAMLSGIETADLMIVDHYGIGIDWETKVKHDLKCLVMAIDDILRKHNVDILLDQTLNRDASLYDAVRSKILAGTKFALLDPSFNLLRGQALDKEWKSEVPNVLVSMGGVDKQNATLQVLQMLDTLNIKMPTTVLLSERSPHFNAVSEFCLSRPDWITHIEFSEQMATLMIKHDIAIGAPGSTSWERACLGLPSIVIPLAENQHNICDELVLTGAAEKVELSCVRHQLLPAIACIKDSWDDYKLSNLHICDGFGVNRVTQHIEGVFTDNDRNV